MMIKTITSQSVDLLSLLTESEISEAQKIINNNSAVRVILQNNGSIDVWFSVNGNAVLNQSLKLAVGSLVTISISHLSDLKFISSAETTINIGFANVLGFSIGSSPSSSSSSGATESTLAEIKTETISIGNTVETLLTEATGAKLAENILILNLEMGAYKVVTLTLDSNGFPSYQKVELPNGDFWERTFVNDTDGNNIAGTTNWSKI